MDNKKKRFKKKKAGKKGKKWENHKILFSFPHMQRDIAPICLIIGGPSKKLMILWWFLSFPDMWRQVQEDWSWDWSDERGSEDGGGRTISQDDLIQSLELFDFLSIYQDSSSGHVSNRLQALWQKLDGLRKTCWWISFIQIKDSFQYFLQNIFLQIECGASKFSLICIFWWLMTTSTRKIQAEKLGWTSFSKYLRFNLFAM